LGEGNSIGQVIFKGEIITKMGWGHLNYWANFNQAWHKSPLGSGFKFVQLKGIALLQGEIIAKE
jgi:hypothetical protein